MKSIYLTNNVLYYPNLLFLAVVNKEKYIEHLNKSIDNHIQSKETKLSSKDHYFNYNVEVDKIYPTNGGISLTDFCQLRCSYCSFSSSNLKNKLSKDDIRSFVDYLIKNALLRRMLFPNEQTVRLVITGGGEPTSAWSEFVDTVEYMRGKCAQKNIQCQISATTNGILNQTQRDFLFKNLDSILVSYDGLPRIQNKNRKKTNNTGSANIVEETLSYFDNKKANYSIRTTIWPEDYYLMPEMADYIYTKYSHNRAWAVEPIIPRGRAIENVQDEFANSEFTKFYIATKKHICEKGYVDTLSCSKFNSYTCGTIYGFHPWLVPNGDVVTCQDAKEDAVKIGRINQGIMKLVDFHDEYAELHDINLLNCKKCFAYGFCLGGCPLKKLNAESEQQIVNECAIIGEYWRTVLVELIDKDSYLGWKKVIVDSSPGKFTIYKLERVI